MKMRFVRTLLIACMTGALALGSTAAAGADKLSHDVGVALQAANEALKANDLPTAAAKVQEAMAVADRTDFDTYTIEQFAANVSLKQNDLKGAEAHFKAVATSPALREEDKRNVYTVLLQVATNLQDWPTVVQYGSLLQGMNALEANLVEPLAVAYFNTGDHARALAIAQAQISADKAAGRQSSEALLEIVMDSQANSPASNAMLEDLVVNYGDPNNWARLIETGFGKGMTDLQALNLYRLRIATDAKTIPEDYAIMATVTTKAGYPGEAVAMLEHGLAKGEITSADKAAAQLATARQKKAEDMRSLPAFAAQARAAAKGELDVKLAETYFGYGRFAEAEEAARRAMSKGGLKNPSEAPMVLGMALAREGKNQEAVEAFSKVDGNANDQKIAHFWTLFAERKYSGTQATH